MVHSVVIVELVACLVELLAIAAAGIRTADLTIIYVYSTLYDSKRSASYTRYWELTHPLPPRDSVVASQGVVASRDAGRTVDRQRREPRRRRKMAARRRPNPCRQANNLRQPRLKLDYRNRKVKEF